MLLLLFYKIDNLTGLLKIPWGILNVLLKGDHTLSLELSWIFSSSNGSGRSIMLLEVGDALFFPLKVSLGRHCPELKGSQRILIFRKGKKSWAHRFTKIVYFSPQSEDNNLGISCLLPAPYLTIIFPMSNCDEKHYA